MQGERDLAVERVISLAFGVLCCSQVNTCSARTPLVMVTNEVLCLCVF